MSPEAELAELVDILFSRGKPIDVAVGSMVSGLADIGNALMDAQAMRGNWGSIIANLRVGAEKVRVAIDPVRKMGGPGFEGLAKYAERHLRFAMGMIDDVIRLQANESTTIIRLPGPGGVPSDGGKES